MKRALPFIVFILVVLLTACQTPVVKVVEVEPVDLGPGIDLLFDSRPKNDQLNIIEDVRTFHDVINNSAEFLRAWELWETYAESLEHYLNTLRLQGKNQ